MPVGWSGLLATKRCPSVDEEELVRKLDAGEDVELPDDLAREADKHLQRRAQALARRSLW